LGAGLVERLTGLQDPGGLGALGQERRLVVGGDLAQLARVGPEGPAHAQPHHQQDERYGPPGPAGCGSHRTPPAEGDNRWKDGRGSTARGRAGHLIDTSAIEYLDDRANIYWAHERPG